MIHTFSHNEIKLCWNEIYGNITFIAFKYGNV